MEGEENLNLLKQALENVKANAEQALYILNRIDTKELKTNISKTKKLAPDKVSKNAKIIEGVFDGQNMIDAGGKVYSIAPNYASKSKLVEGDILKLTIMPDGSFLYKQIGPVDRKRLVGTLLKDEDSGEFRVLANGRSYKVILASVTYFKGDNGDQAVILVPKEQDSNWAAVENVIKEGQELPSGLDSMELEEGFDAELLQPKI
jgi:hypothetical protein